MEPLKLDVSDGGLGGAIGGGLREARWKSSLYSEPLCDGGLGGRMAGGCKLAVSMTGCLSP